jgi:hypothetical protein
MNSVKFVRARVIVGRCGSFALKSGFALSDTNCGKEGLSDGGTGHSQLFCGAWELGCLVFTATWTSSSTSPTLESN